MTKNQEMADVYLNYISAFIKSGDQWGHIFRAMAEGYYGNKYGAPFLTPSGRPNWFSQTKRLKSELLRLHFVSSNAHQILKLDKDTKKIVVDHAVPLKKLRGLLKDTNGDRDSIESVFLKFYVLSAITKEEHDCLARLKLRSKMPCNWDNKNPFARYEAANILGETRSRMQG